MGGHTAHTLSILFTFIVFSLQQYRTFIMEGFPLISLYYLSIYFLSLLQLYLFKLFSFTPSVFHLYNQLSLCEFQIHSNVN